MATSPRSNSKGINDLPIEMFLEVFQYLSLRQSIRYSTVCRHWRESIALHILAPEILRLTASNPAFKNLLEKNGWSEECSDTELLLLIYNKMMNPITSELLTSFQRYSIPKRIRFPASGGHTVALRSKMDKKINVCDGIAQLFF